MYKLAVLPLFFAAVSAGYLGAAPALYGAGLDYAHAAPLAATYAAAAPVIAPAAAPLAYAHAAPAIATSYANTFRATLPYAAYAGPAIAAPLAHAPAIAAPLAHAAPLAVAHGPLAYSAPLGHPLPYAHHH